MIYLGKHGTPASRERYDQLIAEWLANDRQSPVEPVRGLTVRHMLDGYRRHAANHYRKPDGTPTTGYDNVLLAIEPLERLYGSSPAADFGPRALRAVRAHMIERGWCQGHINSAVGKVKLAFRWAASHELVPASVPQALDTVAGLRKGRTKARETDPVKPVPDADISAVQPFVSRQVWALIQLQLLTGARGGELLTMRAIDLDATGKVWTYTPGDHKTAHHGHTRTIYLGPKAQDVLRPFMPPARAIDAYLFKPREALAEAKTRNAKSGRRPDQKPNPRQTDRTIGDHYTRDSYRRAIARACDQAFPPPEPLARCDGETIEQWHARLTDRQRADLKAWQKDHRWHPHQLRHNAATRIRREFDIDAARATSSTAHLTRNDGGWYPVSGVQVVYEPQRSTLPPVDQLMQAPVVLGEISTGLVAYRPGLSAGKPPSPSSTSARKWRCTAARSGRSPRRWSAG
jgi:integrase